MGEICMHQAADTQGLKHADLLYCILFLYLLLLCGGQRKLWSRVRFIFFVSP